MTAPLCGISAFAPAPGGHVEAFLQRRPAPCVAKRSEAVLGACRRRHWRRTGTGVDQIGTGGEVNSRWLRAPATTITERTCSRRPAAPAAPAFGAFVPSPRLRSDFVAAKQFRSQEALSRRRGYATRMESGRRPRTRQRAPQLGPAEHRFASRHQHRGRSGTPQQGRIGSHFYRSHCGGPAVRMHEYFPIIGIGIFLKTI